MLYLDIFVFEDWCAYFSHMTFDEKHIIWKDFLKWGKEQGYFSTAKGLGNSLEYEQDNWSSKAINKARERKADFPEALWRIVLCGKLFGGYVFPSQVEPKSTNYEIEDHPEDWTFRKE